jgi:hypothetical protein
VKGIEQVGVAVMLLTCIGELLSSNFGRDTVYPEGFRDFPQTLEANNERVLQLGHDCFHFKSIHIHYSSVILLYDAI